MPLKYVQSITAAKGDSIKSQAEGLCRGTYVGNFKVKIVLWAEVHVKWH